MRRSSIFRQTSTELELQADIVLHCIVAEWVTKFKIISYFCWLIKTHTSRSNLTLHLTISGRVENMCFQVEGGGSVWSMIGGSWTAPPPNWNRVSGQKVPPLWIIFLEKGGVFECRRSIITSLIYEKSQNLMTNKIWSKIGIFQAFLDL